MIALMPTLAVVLQAEDVRYMYSHELEYLIHETLEDRGYSPSTHVDVWVPASTPNSIRVEYRLMNVDNFRLVLY